MPVRLGQREHSGFSVNPKSTIILQLLQVPMATDLASGEKTSWFGWKESLWISILSMPSHIPWWKAKYPKLLVSHVFLWYPHGKAQKYPITILKGPYIPCGIFISHSLNKTNPLLYMLFHLFLWSLGLAASERNPWNGLARS